MDKLKNINVPNFVVIGAPKCGTTSLYFYLMQHPEIFLPKKKELHYFSYKDLSGMVEGPGDKEILEGLCDTFAKYKNNYSDIKNEKAIGEISPSYLYYKVQSRIKKEIGGVKIVIMLRNPVDKAYSQYMHLVRDQREGMNFHDALLAENTRIAEGWSDIWRYASSSLYLDSVRAYFECFGRENVHIIEFNNFVSNTPSVLKGLYQFLGVDDNYVGDTHNIYNRTGGSKYGVISKLLNNSNIFKSAIKRVTPDLWRVKIRMKIMELNTGVKPEMDENSYKYLKNYFAKDVAELEKLTGHDMGWIDTDGT